MSTLPDVMNIVEVSTFGLEAMNRAVEQHRITPVIERVFGMHELRDAFALMQQGGHFGKIGSRIAEDGR